ncbi:MAG: ATP-binding cassette domain-containing protein [Clostridiaceae bacterium]
MSKITEIPLLRLLDEHPYIEDFFNQLGITKLDKTKSCREIAENLSEEFLEDRALSKYDILNNFGLFLENMNILNNNKDFSVESISIIGGNDKSGNKEEVNLTLKKGEVICIVGPTGSGKSRLLEDIESLAQQDTPTNRQILINNNVPSEEVRFSMQNKLVAQLSQNMNFVMDLTVKEFITIHAESRMIENIDNIVASIIECANDLAGEKFTLETPVTQLSGGQSRALMIADTALLSSSPIVLIDEIENAGVDRKKSLELLVKKEKIVLLSTHDPILALLGSKRLVIKNGGINKIINTSGKEIENLELLEIIDCKILHLRDQLRKGKTIDFDILDFFKLL